MAIKAPSIGNNLTALKPNTSLMSSVRATAASPSKTGEASALLSLSTAQDDKTLFDRDFFYRFDAYTGENFSKVFGYEFVIHDTKTGSTLVLPLPLAPQNITMNVAAATTLTTTLKGIVEENNGAPLRQISIQGTTGVLPATATKSKYSNNSARGAVGKYLFKNSIQAINSLVKNVKSVVSLVNSVLGNQKLETKLNYNPSDMVSDTVYTGYRFFHELSRFLDYYLAVKKTKEGKPKRLLFHMHKDKMYYACTLSAFSFVKSQATTEYIYNIQLTAWKRYATPITGTPTAISLAQESTEGVNALAAALLAARKARTVVAESINIIRGISAAADTVLNSVFEVIALGKDILGYPTSIADAFKDVDNDITIHFDSLLRDESAATLLTALNIKDIPNASLLPSDLDNRILKQDDITVDSVPLSPEASLTIINNTNKIKQLDAEDVLKRMQDLETLTSAVNAAFGGDSATANRVEGITRVINPNRKLTPDSLPLLLALDALIFSCAQVRLQLLSTTTADTNYIAYYSEFARNSSIPFTDSTSKYYVPYPHGASLQAVAVQYLGDVNRWVELAAINGLKEPYVDEVGYDLSVSGVTGNIITLPKTPNFYVGEIIEISSTLALGKKKIKVTGIKELSNTALITYEGVIDLTKYGIGSTPMLHAYLPHTINSQKMIAIPSQEPVNAPNRIKLTPEMTDLDKIAQMAGTDILINSDGDIVINANGDIKMAVGFNNLVQAAQIKLLTEAGTLLQSPDFGVGVVAGSSVAEVDAQAILDSINRMFAADNRFTGLEAGEVKVAGGVVTINVLVGVAGVDVYLPLSVALPVSR